MTRSSDRPGELGAPVVVDFPLRGHGWMAVTTPAARIPSHGTDMLGQRFAYDFVKVDDRPGAHVSPAGSVRSALLGGRPSECYAWGEPVHAPFDGEVVWAGDGMPERGWIHPVQESVLRLWNAFTFAPSKLARIMGNHVLMRSGDVFAGFAHLAPGSVAVEVGQLMRAGEVIGHVGHTGNSTSPHLHFQLMDTADLMAARGLACAFRSYEVERGGSWVRISDGIPAADERMRSLEP